MAAGYSPFTDIHPFCCDLSVVYRGGVGEGYVMAQLVEALHYKPEGHGFDSR
jgi:hypothetical protein